MPVPFYRYSYKTATSEMMTDRYRESKAENIRCVKYIEDENTGFYANAYKDNCVDSDGEYTKHLIEEFGLERVMSIYAATLKASIHDGRISPDMKKWASDFNAGLRHLFCRLASIIDNDAEKKIDGHNKTIVDSKERKELAIKKQRLGIKMG